jgi:hypothetical protein
LMIPGDLHGGGIHFLSVSYLLFYGGFLQPLQYALGWKRIRGTDVTKTYQQCAALALLVLGELERGLYGRFIHDLFLTKGSELFDIYREDSNACSTYVGKAFLEWMDERIATTTDEVFRMCLMYTKLTRMYKLFRVSVRAGDSILVEYLYEYYIPIWLVCGKHNYVEIALNQIEDLYRRIPFDVLQTARENRFQPIHAGKDRDGVDMAEWALDAIMELLQIKYKGMNFPDSREGWQMHSTNMPLVARSKVYTQSEYTHMYDVEAFDELIFEFKGAGEKQDKGNTKTQTKVPRRTKEKLMVAEVLSLVDCFNEKEGRKMKDDTFWKVLKDTTTELEEQTSPIASNEEANAEGRSSGEKILVEVNQELVQNIPESDEMPDEILDANEMDQMEWFRVLEENNSGMYDSDDDFEIGTTTRTTSDPATTTVTTTEPAITEPGITEPATVEPTTPTVNVQPTNTVDSTHIVVDEAETVVQIGKSKKVSVRKAKFNRMGVTNVIEKGRQKMIEMNIPDRRFRRKCRIERETKTLQKELDNYLSSMDGTPKLQSILSKLKGTETSNERVEFRMMKKGLWVVPNRDVLH